MSNYVALNNCVFTINRMNKGKSEYLKIKNHAT